MTEKKKPKPKVTPAQKKAIFVMASSMYRSGGMAVSEIAERCGVTTRCIYKWAKDHGWKQDLTHKVRELANEKVLRGDSNSIDAATEDTIVELAAQVQADIISKHKGLLQQIRHKISKALDELPCLEAAKLEGEEALAKTAMLHLSAAGGAANAAHKLIPVERKTYGIDDGEGTGPADYEALIGLAAKAEQHNAAASR